MISVLVILMSIGFSLLILTVVGEAIAQKIPNSKFTKWWRKNIIWV